MGQQPDRDCHAEEKKQTGYGLRLREVAGEVEGGVEADDGPERGGPIPERGVADAAQGGGDGEWQDVLNRATDRQSGEMQTTEQHRGQEHGPPQPGRQQRPPEHAAHG